MRNISRLGIATQAARRPFADHRSLLRVADQRPGANTRPHQAARCVGLPGRRSFTEIELLGFGGAEGRAEPGGLECLAARGLLARRWLRFRLLMRHPVAGRRVRTLGPRPSCEVALQVS